MENLNLDNRKVQNTLHMIINFGEQDDYAGEIKKNCELLAAEFFNGELKGVLAYLQALVTIEIMEHQQEYGVSDMTSAMEMIAEANTLLIEKATV